MPRSEPTSHDASMRKALRAWEPPVLSTLSLRSETRSSREEPAQSAPPRSPSVTLAKLGFSIEAAFPMGSRSDS
jgi:hypothetical protein